MVPWTYNASESQPSIGPQITAIAISFTAISFIFTVFRGYIRVYVVKAVGADDWAIFITWFLSCGFTAVTVLQTKYGLGLLNVDDMPSQNVVTFGKLQYAGAPFYLLGILGFKLSLLFSYLRFVPFGAFRNTVIGVIVATSLFHITVLLTQLNLCQPIAFQWDKSIEGTCLPAVPIYTAVGALVMFNDVVILCLPFPVFLRTKIPTRQKIVLLGLFALGIFITIIQIFRIQTVRALSNYVNSGMHIMWCTIEINLAIVTTCIPTLKTVTKFFADDKSRTGGTTSGDNPGGKFGIQTWRSNTAGMIPLESGTDFSTDRRASKQGSQDFILDSSSILKETEIEISRSPARR